VHSVDPALFREAWARFATGVTVITSAEPDGGVHGMTANGVVSVSVTPPLALASIAHERNTHPLIVRSRRFGISVLAKGQERIALHFIMPHVDRPADSDIEYVRLGESAVVAGALATMDCAVVKEYEAGDHTLFIAEVRSADFTDGEPLLWFRSGFGRFDPAQEHFRE
jgi:flavin reductase (DIM6/NTAB) family NADH-FMN oxidoreductase RutF